MKKKISVLLLLFLFFSILPMKSFAASVPINPWDYAQKLGKGLDVDWSKTKEGKEAYNSQTAKDFSDMGIKHVRIRIKDDMLKAMNYRVDALVLDSSMPGSGELFDWNLLQDINISNKIILAGGLNEDNVLEGISKVKPYGIDISSGVEKVDKDGIRKKDRDKVELFIRKVRDRYEREV